MLKLKKLLLDVPGRTKKVEIFYAVAENDISAIPHYTLI